MLVKYCQPRAHGPGPRRAGSWYLMTRRAAEVRITAPGVRALRELERKRVALLVVLGRVQAYKSIS